VVSKWLLAALVVLCGCAVWLTVDLHRLLVNANTDVVNFAASEEIARHGLDQLNKSLATVNQPCIGDEPCRGTLGLINKTVAKVGDVIVTTQTQERAITPHTVAAMDTLNASAAKLGATAEALTGTAQGATQGLKALTDEELALQEPTRAAAGLLTRGTAAVNDFDSLISDPAIREGLDAGSQTAVHIAGITGDLQVYAHPILNPTPCKTRKCTAGRVVSKTLGALSILATGANATEPFRALKVKVAK
jgi:hypothetical protein